ncbi:MAG: MarR family transcriptional regulator [Candidatus Margulisiibacteriota bacterium]|jgi:DNA-binding MarR family transcriptional regulator
MLSAAIYLLLAIIINSNKKIMDTKNLIGLIINIKNLCYIKETQIRKELGLSLAEYNCLSLIKPQEKITCNDLSKRLELSDSRGSRIIDGLVNKKYLSRNESITDRRVKTINLSSTGAILKEKIETLKNKCEQKLAESLSNSNYEQMKNSLTEIINILSKE